ncbi:protein LNK2-like isoform X2 [Gastrolobium bilobum]|uniref:protein LNK2-like isoform X2 n=1 Tax=Gastrolobium bilobum TaxID=150636 RepID=UPI002AB287A4|nr:protein LNK2-like isoform X2 [Gastrolobium bilobum]
MFDWNDEELGNLIWGETGESDDHIVPYWDKSKDLHNKKELNQEASDLKHIEQKRIEAKTDVHGRKLVSSSKIDNHAGLSASGHGTNSWTDSSDQGSLEKDVEIFQSAHEDKEQGDFVDHAWVNIGSFDDLDRIFSNDDPIFGHVSLESSDELWSSKDVSDSPVTILLEAPSPASALRNRTEPLEVKAEYVQRNDQSFSFSFKRIGDSSSHDTQNAHATTVSAGYARGRSIPTEKEQQDMVGMTTSVTSALAADNVATANGLTDKAFGKKNQLKARKKSQGKPKGKVLQDFYVNWSPTTPSGQFGNQLAPSVMQSYPSSILGLQKQLQGPETVYQNITDTQVASSVYGNITNMYPAMSMLPQAQSGVLRQRPLFSGYEVSPGIVSPVNKSAGSVRPLTMTPQEKIEKLRRRQQMRAILAIQKQQQKLSHQVPGTNKSMTQNCALEMQSHHCDGADPEIEDLRTLPAIDPPTKCDDSNTISMAIDDHFVEDTIPYMLQDIISKIDVKIRLCIRDSLFRLAQSAMQRHDASDSSSTNRSSREEFEVIAREESNSQNRPLELTGNYSDKLDSPISSKMQCESKAANLENFPTGCLPDEDLKSSQQFSHQELKNSCFLFEAQHMDQCKNCIGIDTSDNASNNETADVGDQEVEASQ